VKKGFWVVCRVAKNPPTLYVLIASGFANRLVI